MNWKPCAFAQAELLEQALFSSATIHQPHALKSYLAAQYLYDELQDDALWAQTATLIQYSEFKHHHLFDVTQSNIQFSAQRRKNILRRGVYPASYLVLWQWYKQDGFENIVDYYLKQAAQQNQYLSHDVTLLLAFSELYPRLDVQHIPAFMQRVTEFITVSFKQEYQETMPDAVDHIEDEKLLQDCLQQPSFFGHNLITLAWFLRAEAERPTFLIQKLKHNLYVQATTPLEDTEDELDVALFEQCQDVGVKTFLALLHELIFQYAHNLHQITLADALLYLAQRYPHKISEFQQFVLYQTKQCAAALAR